MAQVVKVRLNGQVRKLNEEALRLLSRKDQISVAVSLGIQLHKGVSKNGLVSLILAK